MFDDRDIDPTDREGIAGAVDDNPTGGTTDGDATGGDALGGDVIGGDLARHDREEAMAYDDAQAGGGGGAGDLDGADGTINTERPG
jgi:hypothetical protein